MKLASYGTFGLHILKVPSGKYAYVGSIPMELCIKKTDQFGIDRYSSPIFESEKDGVDYFNINKPA